MSNNSIEVFGIQLSSITIEDLRAEGISNGDELAAMKIRQRARLHGWGLVTERRFQAHRAALQASILH